MNPKKLIKDITTEGTELGVELDEFLSSKQVHLPLVILTMLKLIQYKVRDTPLDVSCFNPIIQELAEIELLIRVEDIRESN